MSLLFKRPWDHTAKPMSIKATIVHKVIETEGGTAENAQITADNAAELLSQLIETLHDKDVLHDGDVIQLIGAGYEVAS